jgi:S1-C subfamily serine protease
MSEARSAPLESLSSAIADLVAGLAPSVVAVHSHRSRSSGFVWRDGLVVTADEALAEEGDVAVILPGGERLTATVAGRDPTTDIALLRVDRTGLQTARLESLPVRAGMLALAVGSEEGTPTAAFGVISLAGPAWRSLRGGEIDRRLELDLSLRRHAEGGAAVGADGQFVGMTVFGARRRVLVIPSATIQRVATRLESHGRIARGYLGVGLQQVRLDEDKGVGAMVMSVDANGPAATAGVRQGDVIVAWEGQPIASVPAMLRALGPESIGSTVTLTLRRAGEPAEARVTIGERPPG